MKKIILSLLLTLSLVGCGSNNSLASQSIDINAVSKNIIETIAFDDELVEVSDEMVATKYGIDNANEIISYLGSGATSEEVTFFTFENSEEAKKAMDKANAYIEKQKEEFADYIPEEVKRLDKAIVQQFDQSIGIIVCNDDTVKDLLK